MNLDNFHASLLGNGLEANDGEFMIAFGAPSSNEDLLYVKKIKWTGQESWSKVIGNTGPNKCFGFNLSPISVEIEKTTDGGYVTISPICRSGTQDLRLIRIDSSGNVVWDKTIGGSDFDNGRTIKQTSDGGYIIGGTTSSFGENMEMWLCKTDADGEKLWEKNFGKGSYSDVTNVIQTVDGGYLLAGTTMSGSQADIWLVKTDAYGNKIWEKIFGGPGRDVCDSVQSTRDGGYIILATTDSFGPGEEKIWVIKLNDMGSSDIQVSTGPASEKKMPPPPPHKK